MGRGKGIEPAVIGGAFVALLIIMALFVKYWLIILITFVVIVGIIIIARLARKPDGDG